MEYVVYIILGLIILGFFASRHEQKKLLKEYNDALKSKDKANAISTGRKYYKIALRNKDQSSIELTIMNDLKMYGLE